MINTSMNRNSRTRKKKVTWQVLSFTNAILIWQVPSYMKGVIGVIISFLVKRSFSIHKRKTIFMREIAPKKIGSPAGLTLTIKVLVPKN